MVELTLEQKKCLINYCLGSVGKGPFEDCEEFQTDEVEEKFREYREAAENFIDGIRKATLVRLDLFELEGKNKDG